MNSPFAIRVENGCKTFGRNTILQNLQVSVPSGVTYALLGASGCGKTTLLSSVVGLSKLTSGSIKVFGENISQTSRRQIGYMPQETGLHEELTIEEEFYFFGRLYSLEDDEVQGRLLFFVNLLHLPKQTQIIRTLSGGQKRRVSLAIALLHRPRIAILDEPTVGIDPLLRQRIWEYLYKLVREEGVTVILSTHYCEEAKSADVVSVMRHGRLLIEEAPDTLMARHNSILLEDILVKLCHSQEEDQSPSVLIQSDFIPSRSNPQSTTENGNLANVSSNNGQEIVHSSSPSEHYADKEVPFKPQQKPSYIARNFKMIYAYLVLNFITFIRLPLIIGIIVTIPVGQMLTFYFIYSTVPYTDLGVVNLEQPNCFQLPVEEQKLGCELSQFLYSTEKLSLTPFDSEDSALAAVNRGSNYGYLRFPANFSSNMADRVAQGRFAEDQVLNGSSISVFLDYSNFLRNAFFLDGLFDGFNQFVEKKLNDSSGDLGSISTFNQLNPFKFNEKMEQLQSVTTEFSHTAAVSNITAFLMILPAIVAINLIWDKKRGVFQRSIVGGASFPHVVIAALIMYGLLFVLQFSLVLAAISVIDIPFKGSLLDVVVLNYCQSLIGLSYGIFLGLVFKQLLEVILFIMAYFMITSTTLGGISSIESLDAGTRWYVSILPLKIPTVALENILFRGWSISHGGVWPCFIVQAGWTATFFITAAITFYTGRF